MIISQQLIINSGKYLTRSAFYFSGREYKYSELLPQIARLSYLYQAELKPGARVAFFSRNSAFLVATFFAMTNLRVVSIPIDPDAPPEEIITWLKETKATHIAVSNDLANRVRDILRTDRLNLPLIEMEKKRGGEYDSSFTPLPEQVPTENDIILLFRSGGISNTPKFASFTHKQLMNASNLVRTRYRYGTSDRVYTHLNWAHPFAFIHGMFFPFMTGTLCILDEGLEKLEFLKFLKTALVNRIIGTPPFFLKLLMLCMAEKRPLSGIKSITVGTGFLSTDLIKTFHLFKTTVSHCYGQVENLWTIAMEETQAAEGESATEKPRGFLGKGLPGVKYKVVDQNGDEITGAEKRRGQLALTSPCVMQGYYGREKENKNVIRGTWLYTGDFFELEGLAEELTLTFLSRAEDIFYIGSEPVLFFTIDAVIKSNPSVLDAAAFWLKDNKGKQKIVCAVIKKPGVTVVEKDILDSCVSLPKHLIPKNVAFTEVIPKDAGNNPISSRLRNLFSGLAG